MVLSFVPVPLLASAEVLKVGQFITSLDNPQQANHYPKDIPEPPQSKQPFAISGSNQSGYRVSSSLKLIFSATLSRHTKKEAEIASTSGWQYLIGDSDAWFEAAIAAEGTKSWIERCALQHKHIYLIEGIRTLVDPHITLSSSHSHETGGGVDATTALALAGAVISGPLTAVGDVSVEGGYESNKSNVMELKTPGERVCCVLYRELKYDYLHRRPVQPPVLTNKTYFWTCLEGQMRGANDDDDEDYQDEMADGEDILEVKLEEVQQAVEKCETHHVDEETIQIHKPEHLELKRI